MPKKRTPVFRGGARNDPGYYAAQRRKQSAANRRWCKANPERIREYQRTYHMRRKAKQRAGKSVASSSEAVAVT